MIRYSFIVIGCLLALIINAQNGEKIVELKDVVANVFVEKTNSSIRSMNDGEHYARQDVNKIIKVSYKTGNLVDVLFDLSAIKDAPINDFTDYLFSKDETKLMVLANTQKLYRHSTKSDYYIYDIERKTFEALSDKGQQQEASFSADGKRIAFVRDNNIFIKDLRFGTEKQITNDGERNKIINGVPDWVYEEEFAFSKAYEWSPNGLFIAFMRFDESQVKDYSFPLYKGMAPEKSEYDLYAGLYTYKYPKAGEKISKVTVKVYDVKTNQTKEMDLPDESDFYVPRIRWSTSSDKLCILKLNRRQDKLEYYFANPQTTICKLFHAEKNERYISADNLNQLYFIEGQEWFVTLSEKDGYNHAYLYQLDGRLVKQLTSGAFDVTDFYGYDPKRKLFYYQAAASSPLQREVYATDLQGKKKSLLTPEPGTNSVDFSANYNYYLHSFSSANKPMQVNVVNSNDIVMRTIEDNSELTANLKKHLYNAKEFFTFKTSQGVELNGWMVKPLNFNPEIKYPTLMVQYSGPGDQEVLNTWSFAWEHVLAAAGYLVVCVDGRGTGARGEEFKKCTYLELGHLESDDQIEAAKYIGSLDYCDANRIGIWGWSYGGFMTALCMSRSDVFKVGIAVAPTTHHKFYNAIYTERFMRTPKENPAGYDGYAPLELADQLSGKLLLVHGTADDNTHYQNTIEYAERLVQAGKQFEMQTYNNRDHHLSGGNTRFHLYTRKIAFIKANL